MSSSFIGELARHVASYPDVVVVNKLGGVECVCLLLNHVSCIKSGMAPAIPAPTGLVSLSEVQELATRP